MNRRAFLWTAAGASGLIPRLPAGELNSSDGHELIGTPAPPLHLKRWIHSPPLEISDLRGRVVLLRWWTQGCPFCEATAPALRKLQREYGDAGLVVIGIYHPKPPGPFDLASLEAAAEEKRFYFPVALDSDWSALKRWWLTRDRDYTSVSFVVDRQSIIRYVHPGGEFHEGSKGGLSTHASCNRDYRTIDAEISRLVRG